MQQEDDLRGLAKVMDFMRALSILFVVINVYWFCYGQIVEWRISIGGAAPYQGLCRHISRPLVSWNERRKGRKNYMATNHRNALGGRRAVFLQLVAAGAAASDGCEHGVLHTDRIGRIYLPAHGRRMDCPSAEKQSDGRRVQHRERIVPAGDAPLDQRILGEPAHALLLPQAMERGVDQRREPVRSGGTTFWTLFARRSYSERRAAERAMLSSISSSSSRSRKGSPCTSTTSNSPTCRR